MVQVSMSKKQLPCRSGGDGVLGTLLSYFNELNEHLLLKKLREI